MRCRSHWRPAGSANSETRLPTSDYSRADDDQDRSDHDRDPREPFAGRSGNSIEDQARGGEHRHETHRNSERDTEGSNDPLLDACGLLRARNVDTDISGKQRESAGIDAGYHSRREGR